MGSGRSKILTWVCTASAIAALGAGLACNEHSLKPFSTSLKSGKTDLSETSKARPVDILFIIDNSNSMAEEQKDLAGEFNTFLTKLEEAGADYRLAVVTTEMDFRHDYVKKPIDSQKLERIVTGEDKAAEAKKIIEKCNAYFKAHPDQPWIASKDPEIKEIDDVKSLFACLALRGDDGSGVERGLESSIRVFEKKVRAPIAKNLEALYGTDKATAETEKLNEKEFLEALFKGVNFDKDSYSSFLRPGAILSVVYVTDENDCSSYNKEKIDNKTPMQDLGAGDKLDRCEYERNIEDSCTVSRLDAVNQPENGENPSIIPYMGPYFTSQDKENVLRSWCVEGNRTALEAYFNAGAEAQYERALIEAFPDTENPEKSRYTKDHDFTEAERKKLEGVLGRRLKQNIFVNCQTEFDAKNAYPSLKCANRILSRRALYHRLINYIKHVNQEGYAATEEIKNLSDDNLKNAKMREMARDDVIVALVGNRDVGVRYNKYFQEKWCGQYGSSSYRYQLFSEMFKMPIFAPICCLEKFGDSCKDLDESVAGFGATLGIIGQRIGESINTMCLQTKPVTCKPQDCEGDNQETCPCTHGCNSKEYFASSPEYGYHLCNEFKLVVGEAPKDNPDALTVYERDNGSNAASARYKANFESSYCMVRTGSPIEINLLKKVDPNKSLVIQYPRSSEKIVK